MAVFGKDEEDELEDILTETEDDVEELDDSGKSWEPTEEEEEKEKTEIDTGDISLDEETEKQLNRLQAAISENKATLQTLKEMQSSRGKQLENFSEKIGQLREMAMGNEKSLSEIRSIAEKAEEMVEGVQPEALKKDLHKRDVKREKLSARIQSLEDRINQFGDQLSDFRETVSMFEDIDRINEMKEDMENSLGKLRELQQRTAKDSNKTHDMFLDIQGKLSDVQKIKEQEENLREDFKDLEKTVDQMHVDIEKKVNSEEFHDKITERLEGFAEKSRVDELSEQLQDLSENLNEFEGCMEDWENNIEKMVDKVFQKVKGQGKMINKVIRGLNKNTRRIEELEGMHQDVGEVPPHLKDWIKENLRKGYSPEDVKESLRKAGENPKWVDRCLLG